jgi:hypothetical protein
MLSVVARRVRRFSTILPSGEKAERELSAVEREMVNLKEAEFSKLGLYRKRTTNVKTLMKLFQLAQPRNKSDYAACMYSVNHFYNFGVEFDHPDFTNRWLALAIETSRVDEAVEIVKTWHTWLPHPPRIELVNVLMGMVKEDQAVELMKAVRENWQMPVLPSSYTVVLSRLLESSEAEKVSEAYDIWRDSVAMDVALDSRTHRMLENSLRECSRTEDADHVHRISIQQAPGGLV